jgi:hypothetical protein
MGWKVCYPKHTNTHGPTDTHTQRRTDTHTQLHTHRHTHTNAQNLKQCHNDAALYEVIRTCAIWRHFDPTFTYGKPAESKSTIMKMSTGQCSSWFGRLPSRKQLGRPSVSNSHHRTSWPSLTLTINWWHSLPPPANLEWASCPGNSSYLLLTPLSEVSNMLPWQSWQSIG